MMMKPNGRLSGIRGILSILIAGLLSAAPQTVWSVGGNSSGGFLLKSPGAKSAGMAEAYSSFGSDAGGIETLPYNPASTAFLATRQASLMGLRGVADDTYGTFLFGSPTPLGSLATQLVYYSLGDIDLIDRAGVIRTVKAEQDWAMSVNYSDRLLLDNLASGLTIKYLRSTLVDTKASNAWAADIGLQARFVDDQVAVGFSFLNLGSQLNYIDAGESLPSTIRFGSSYSLPVEANGKLRVAFDVLQTRDENWKQYLGAEYTWSRIVAFRAGYKNGQDQGKLNFGMGFFWNRYELDYAFTDAGRLGSVHTVSVSARFGQASSGDDRSFDRGVRSVREKKPRGEASKVRRSLLVLDPQPLSNNSEDAAAFGKALQENFESQSKSFIIIPRSDVLALQRSRNRENVPCNDLRCAQDVGTSLGAGKAIVSSLSSFGSLYVYSVKMVDLRTGGIDYVESGEASSVQQLSDHAQTIVNKFLQLSR